MGLVIFLSDRWTELLGGQPGAGWAVGWAKANMAYGQVRRLSGRHTGFRAADAPRTSLALCPEALRVHRSSARTLALPRLALPRPADPL